MLFRRRNTESFWTRLRVHAWPRTSWSRSSRYVVYRVRRLSATPHAVALGFAAGAFSAITPFLGTHIVMAIAIAWIIGGSLVAAVLGTFLGNPLTYPVLWYSTYVVGNAMTATTLAGRRARAGAGLNGTEVVDEDARCWRGRHGGCDVIGRQWLERYGREKLREGEGEGDAV